MILSHLESAGVELEGYWDRDNPVSGDLKDEVSLHEGRAHEWAGEHPGSECGYNDWEALSQFMRQSYPDRVTAECGMHVHLGAPDVATRDWFYNPEFMHRIHTALRRCALDYQIHLSTKRWLECRIQTGRSTPRGSVWCKPNDWTLSDPRDQDRYVQLNAKAWCDYRKTVELRLLPMAKGGPGEAIRMVRAVLVTANRWLQASGPTVSGVITVPAGLSLTPSRRPYHSEISLGF